MNFDNLELDNYLDDDLIENYSSDLEKELEDHNTIEPEWIDIELNTCVNLSNEYYESKNIQLNENMNNRYIQFRISNIENWFCVLKNLFYFLYDEHGNFSNYIYVSALDAHISHIFCKFYEDVEDSDTGVKYISIFEVDKHISSFRLSFNKLDNSALPIISFRILNKKSTDIIIPRFFDGKSYLLNRTVKIDLFYSSFYIIACSSRIDNDEIIIDNNSEQFVYYKIYEHSLKNIYIYAFADINKIHRIEDIKNRIIVERINSPSIYNFNKHYSESIKKKLHNISALNYNKDKMPTYPAELSLDTKNILSEDSAILSIYC